MIDGARRVFIHIGAPKTGTTYLQDVLWTNRHALRANGMLYPGIGPGSHIMASLDLRQISFKGYRNPEVPGAWGRLVDEIRDFGGPAIIDHELLSGAKVRQVQRALRTLDFAEVHIVYTARDMARQLPAAWQEWVRNRETDTMAEWLRSVHSPNVDDPADPGRLFWRLHDMPVVLDRWTRGVPAERVHLITVPPPGSDPDILWKRFAGVVGIDPDAYDTESSRARPSLAAPQTEVLRRVNLAIGKETFPWKPYDRIVKRYLSFELGNQPGPAIALPKDEFDWAVEWSRQAVQKFSDAGYDVAGDLDELIPIEQRSGVDPASVSAEAQAEAAIGGIAALLARYEKEWRAQQKTPNQVRAQRRTATQLAEARRVAAAARQELLEHELLTPRARIRKCAVEVAEQVAWLRPLYRRYRSLRRR